MQIGYVTFNTEERQKVMKVLQMVRDQTAIDELGLGRIRDAFANEMFPGMSTLQRRAKYFAVLPSLYYEATKLKYRSVQEVHRQIIHWEIRLTEMLLNGAAEDDRNGITGSSMLEQAKHDESKFVRYDPTYIYQTGLRMYGMIRSNANLERMIFSHLPTRMQLSATLIERFGIFNNPLIWISKSVFSKPIQGWNFVITFPIIGYGRLLLRVREIIPSDISTACVNTR